MKSTAEYLRDLLLTCPEIATAGEDKVMHLDFIDSAGDSYSVDSSPTASEVKKYQDGSAMLRFAFALTSVRDVFSDDDRMKNAEHYETLSKWMRTITKRRQFTDMGDGRQAMEINPTGNPYITARDPDGVAANYQMAGELIYLQRG
jgi:hypothetical protein